MSDLVERLRHADEYEPLGHDGWEAADRIEALEAENLRLREAIAFYANPDNYISSMWSSNPLSRDNGRRARAVLGEGGGDA